MITEDYVSFEVAKLLKEKGFDIPCDNYYDSSGKTPNESIYGGVSIKTLDYNADPFIKSGFPKFKTFSAPTQSIALKWLREENIIIVIQPEYFNLEYKCSAWGVDIWCDDNYEKMQGNFPTYEEACEAACLYVLNNLI